MFHSVSSDFQILPLKLLSPDTLVLPLVTLVGSSCSGKSLIGAVLGMSPFFTRIDGRSLHFDLALYFRLPLVFPSLGGADNVEDVAYCTPLVSYIRTSVARWGSFPPSWAA